MSGAHQGHRQPGGYGKKLDERVQHLASSNSRIVHTVIFDLEIPPERNPAYLLEEPEDPVFVSFPDGTVIHSPFPFVTSIDKKRLEPYEMKVVEKSGLKDQED